MYIFWSFELILISFYYNINEIIKIGKYDEIKKFQNAHK